MPSARQRNILVADDDPEITELVREIFEEAGWEVRTAADGEEAVRLVSARPPSALLLDFNLPDMTGFEVLAHITQGGAEPAFPVIMLTGQDSDEFVRQSFEVGAVDFVSKPFAPSQLRSRVEASVLRAET